MAVVGTDIANKSNRINIGCQVARVILVRVALYLVYKCVLYGNML